MLEAEFWEAVRGLPVSRCEYFSSIGSTNDVVAAWGQAGATGLCLAYADEQTRGRGRVGKNWFTPPKSALAFSLLLDPTPTLAPNLLGLVSGLGALAVCEALEKLYGLTPQIKWPNDVLLGGKKACGVLAEAQWSGNRLASLVLGIGINVAPASVPPPSQLNFPATCVEAVLDKKADPAKLLRLILERLIALKDKLNDPYFIESWERRLAFKGETVTLESSAGLIKGVILGLSGDGRLNLRKTNGEEQVLNIGEIQIRP